MLNLEWKNAKPEFVIEVSSDFMGRESLNDREKIFEFIYDFNPDAAEKTYNPIEAKATLSESCAYSTRNKNFLWIDCFL